MAAGGRCEGLATADEVPFFGITLLAPCGSSGAGRRYDICERVRHRALEMGTSTPSTGKRRGGRRMGCSQRQYKPTLLPSPTVPADAAPPAPPSATQFTPPTGGRRPPLLRIAPASSRGVCSPCRLRAALGTLAAGHAGMTRRGPDAATAPRQSHVNTAPALHHRSRGSGDPRWGWGRHQVVKATVAQGG